MTDAQPRPFAATCLPAPASRGNIRTMDTTRSSLLQRVRDPGDGESWQEFVDLYHPLLTKYVASRGLAEVDVEDVVQQTFQKLLNELPKFELNRAKGRFRTWLWRVMHNAVVDSMRKDKRRAAAEEARREELIEQQAQFVEPDDSWEQDLRQRALTFSLDRVRQQSQANTWACFDRHILQGHPSAEVAQELSMTVNAVNVNCSRVLARVSSKCREYLEDLTESEDAEFERQ